MADNVFEFSREIREYFQKPEVLEVFIAEEGGSYRAFRSCPVLNEDRTNVSIRRSNPETYVSFTSGPTGLARMIANDLAKTKTSCEVAMVKAYGYQFENVLCRVRK